MAQHPSSHHAPRGTVAGLIATPPRRRLLIPGGLSRKQMIGLTILLGVMTALGPATVDMYLPALPALEVEFATTTAAVQATLTGSLVGMAAGQLIIGPLSDGFGRRRPLIAGVAVHVVASLAMMFSPTIEALSVLRAVQGFGAAASSIVAMAIVRDLFTGRGASTMLSRLMLVTGIAPVLAPAIGGAMLDYTGWRGIFAVLAVTSFTVLGLCAWALPETLPREHRIQIRPRAMAVNVGGLLKDRIYLGCLLTQAFMFAASFSYVSGMSFILQGGFGLSPSQFGYLFSAGTFGMIVMSQVNPLLLRRFAPGQVLVIGLVGVVTVATVMSALTLAEIGGMWGLLIPVWGCLAFQQLISPNTMTMALAKNGHRAGTAAAFMTASVSLAGAAAAPLLGAIGSPEPWLLAVIMLAAYCLAAISTSTLIRRSGVRASDVEPSRVIPPGPAD